MKVKTIVTVALLLFVTAGIVTLIVRESGNDLTADSEFVADHGATETQLQKDRIAVYYLHGNVRCQTCNTLEAYSKEAVESLSPDDLESGRIEWQVINYDEAQNEHFIQDYNLSYQALVLVDIRDGKEVGHTNLDKIWDLVGDKPAYLEYVREGISAKLVGLD